MVPVSSPGRADGLSRRESNSKMLQRPIFVTTFIFKNLDIKCVISVCQDTALEWAPTPTPPTPNAKETVSLPLPKSIQ